MDNLFKDHFSKSTAPVENKEALWQAIEAKRQPNRRFLLWWSIGIVVLLAGATWLAWPVDSSENLPDTKMEQLQPKPATPVTAEIQEVASGNKVDTKNDSKQLDLPTINTQSTVSPAIVKTQPESIAKSSIQSSGIATASSPTKALATSRKKSVMPPAIPAVAASGSKDTNKAASFPARQTASTTTKLPARQATVHPALPTIANPPVASLEIPGTKLTFAGKTELPAAENKNWDKCRIKESGSFFIKAYGEVAMPFENIGYNDAFAPKEFPDYKEQWAEKFNPFLSYAAGLQFGYTFPWNGYLSTGLAYEHFQTSFETSQRVVEQITVFDEMAYFYVNDAGETIWVGDSVQVTNIYDRTEKRANNHRLWHIPVQLGYIATMKNFRLGGNVELLFNLSKSYKGFFLAANGSVLEIDTANDAGYMSTSLGVGVSAGAHIGFLLGDHVELYVRPGFRLAGGSYVDDTDKTGGLRVSRSFAGLRCGAVFGF